MTKKDIDIVIAAMKDFVSELLNGWGLTPNEKNLVSFEQQHLPYTRYSGNQSIDHVVFRKFLHYFDPKNIEDGIAEQLKGVYEERIKLLEEENEALRKKLAEVEQLAYAGL